jgi:hypothetical protein
VAVRFGTFLMFLLKVLIFRVRDLGKQKPRIYAILIPSFLMLMALMGI